MEKIVEMNGKNAELKRNEGDASVKRSPFVRKKERKRKRNAKLVRYYNPWIIHFTCLYFVHFHFYLLYFHLFDAIKQRKMCASVEASARANVYQHRRIENEPKEKERGTERESEQQNSVSLNSVFDFFFIFFFLFSFHKEMACIIITVLQRYIFVLW